MDKLEEFPNNAELDQLLYPGHDLHDVDISKLSINIMPSGFITLDREYMLLKEQESELIIVGGRPSMGKSAFMFQLALNVASYGGVHVFSLEMSRESIVRRLLSQSMNKPIESIQRGLVNPALLAEHLNKLSFLKYFIDDRSGINIVELCDAARQRHRKVPTKLIVIDYLQLLRGEKGHSKDDEIGKVTNELKVLAKEIKCPIVVASQLNRQCEIRGNQTGDYRPLLSDLRDSGNIEQDADIVLAVHRDYKYTRTRANEADILILKNRNGKVGELVMKFDYTKTSFEDLGGEVL